VDAVARSNVGQAIATIRNSSPILLDLEHKGQVRIAGAMYDLHTGAVTFM
jgi:carbonic anhydrase